MRRERKIIEGFKNGIFLIHYDERESFKEDKDEEDEREKQQEELKKQEKELKKQKTKKR